MELQRTASAKGTKAKLAKTGPTTCDRCHGKPGRLK
jgi:cytochrome c553